MTQGIGGSSAEEQLSLLQERGLPVDIIQPQEYVDRLTKAQSLLQTSDSDVLIINAGDNLRYFSGLAWTTTERLVCMVLRPQGSPVFICPAFEKDTLLASVSIEADIVVWEEHEDPHCKLADLVNEYSILTLAIDPLLAFTHANQIKKQLKDVHFNDATDIIDACRMCKSDNEIALLQHAKNITLEVHKAAAAILKPGISTAEVKQFIDAAHKKLGGSGSTFCIVLFGEATMYPHGVPHEQYLKEGDLVLIDTGCRIAGYNSDITRTYVFGEPSEEQRHYWELEKEAQSVAFNAAKLGEPCEVVDNAVREFFVAKGLGPEYQLPGCPHRTGHGIGLSIHESPYLVKGEKTPLAVGMCFSNEPMIVVPGKLGIRLEDHFYMTADGPKWFTEPSLSIDKPFG
ncbi:aminopeptidase P family protein [Alteromonadaceae bacterium M269]|nr:aminopeptidase P family protein [Alteromonadaceae bacterium M269]